MVFLNSVRVGLGQKAQRVNLSHFNALLSQSFWCYFAEKHREK